MVTRKPRRYLEHEQQALLFNWAILASSRYPELRLLHAIPNWAGVKGPREGAMRKRDGVKAGVPDVHLPVARGPYIGLWIEMKPPPALAGQKRLPTPDQKVWMAALREAGHRVEVCYSTQEARAVIEEYLSDRTR